MGIAWIFFGGLIGAYASQRRGFNMAGGIITGILSGPFSLLMFFASSGRKKCPGCDEWIKEKAKVCPHCQSEIAKLPAGITQQDMDTAVNRLNNKRDRIQREK